MCGRYTLTRQDDIIESLHAQLELSAAQDPWWKPRFNVAPTQPAPVITRRDDGARLIELMRWGLIPSWASPGAGGKPRPPLMINARVESLPAKRVFRDALEGKRCLVPADGFFEWMSRSQPFYFHPRSRGTFAFAGLWARARADHGPEHRSFTIITTNANDLVRPIHDRMPIVLPPESYAAWLDPAVDAQRARALLDAAGDVDWIREPVSTWVNKADHDDPACIAAETPDPIPRQGRLFE